jgi:simple sugar transport system substrate-binding protein
MPPQTAEEVAVPRIDWGLSRRGLLSAPAIILAARRAAAAEPLKAAFVYVAPIGDAGWSYQHELGRRGLAAVFGDAIRTSFVENVAEGDASEHVIRKLAADGNTLIFTTSFGYMNPTLKIATQFPDHTFEHATGYKRAVNMATYSARFYEGRYVAGIIAGRMSRSGMLGCVAAFPIPEVVQGINAFILGAGSVNAKAQLKIAWTNAWFAPAAERAAAAALIAAGADLLTHHTDSTAVTQACEEKSVWSIGYHSDQSKYGPKTSLTAVTHVWTGYYLDRVKAVRDGGWKPTDTWNGMNTGMIKLAPYNAAVPEAVRAEADAQAALIAAGKLRPFQGPIADRGGNLRVAAGAGIADKDILEMKWFAEGVQAAT